jgi:hypothetical protein
MGEHGHLNHKRTWSLVGTLRWASLLEATGSGRHTMPARNSGLMGHIQESGSNRVLVHVHCLLPRDLLDLLSILVQANALPGLAHYKTKEMSLKIRMTELTKYQWSQERLN